MDTRSPNVVEPKAETRLPKMAGEATEIAPATPDQYIYTDKLKPKLAREFAVKPLTDKEEPILHRQSLLFTQLWPF